MRRIFFLTILFPFLAAGQNLAPKVMDVKVQSPEASSLGRFGDIPVGKFTGTANITIPIYELKVGDFTLPISLRYHPSGITVDETATNVGLGWALDAGGVISRTVNGLDDFSADGYVNTPYKLTHAFNSEITYDFSSTDPLYPGGYDYFLAKKISEGLVDSKPDMHSYNFAGYSGKFYLDQNAQPHPVPFNSMKYEWLGDLKYKITDTKGIKYFFTDYEQTDVPGNCGESIQTATYLSKIILPNSDSIVFIYDDLTYQYDTKGSYARTNLLPGETSIGAFLITQQLDCFGGPTYTHTDITSKRLKSITTSRGASVEFNYTTDRLDLLNTKMLNSISIKYGTNTIKSYTLDHSYFGNLSLSTDPNTLRLKLDSITTGSPGYKYKFSYNTDIALPSRLSYAIDHYGYYNGQASNLTLLPIDYEKGFQDGANREIDPNYTQAAILKTITYPTGGRSEFTYEPNDYHFVGAEKTFTPKNYFLAGSPHSITTRTFTVPAAPVQVLNAVAIFVGNETGGPLDNPPVDSTTYIQLSGDNGYYNEWANQSSPSAGISLGNLLPGTYTMTVNTAASYTNTYMTVAFQEMLPQNVDKNKLTGGLRIKSIAAYTGPADLTPVKKDYVYTDAESSLISSGKINFDPTYVAQMKYSVAHEVIINQQVVDYYFTDHLYWRQVDNPFLPLSSIQGNTVGYTRVEELDGTGANNGKTVNTYSYEPDFGGSLSYPLVPTISRDWYNGLPLTETVYKKQASSFLPVTNKTNYYSARPESEFWNSHYIPATYNGTYTNGLGVGVEYRHAEYILSLVIYPAAFRWNDYHYVSKWVRLDSTISTTYDQNSVTAYLQQTEKYNYSNLYNLQPTSIIKKVSNGNVVEMQRLYPNDAFTGLSTPAALAKQKLIDNNDIETVLQEKQFSNSTELIAIRNNYTLYSDEPRLSLIQRSAKAQSYTDETTVNAYDDKGNIQDFVTKAGVVNSIVWGYKKQYPVAKITGKSYADVVSLSGIDMGIIDNPLSDGALRTELNKIRSLSGCFVSSYTYSPLVGITSETDPNNRTIYYEYDLNNRLKLVRDEDNNILKKICYNYAGQPEDCGTAAALYYNTAITETVTKNDCGGGYTGSTVTYTVPANAYYSTISQAAAQAVAQDFMDATKQAYANANGGCTVPLCASCTGEDHKCIKANCETGVKIYTSTIENPDDNPEVKGDEFICTYHYEWSDGSWSVDYTVISSQPCFEAGCFCGPVDPGGGGIINP